MSGCLICEEMRPVVLAAEDLVDEAAVDDNENAVVAAASALKIAVWKYRNMNKESETEGKDGVHEIH